jgi:hypothetical protein
VSCLQGRFGVSERRACRLTSQHRSSQRYQRRLVPDELLLRERLQLLARRHPRYGYRRIHAILRREGWACNRKRVQRLWRDEGLRLPARPKRRRRGPRMPGDLAAAAPNEVWAIDFVSDRTADGHPFAIEGTGSFGAGLTRFLTGRGERVLEVSRLRRERRSGGKSDALDAIRAARSVLGSERPATPRAGGQTKLTHPTPLHDIPRR